MQSEVLSGWKDIAKYLGNGVRTAQRYELELGLPVRRSAGRTKGSVIALKSELDAWVGSRRPAEPAKFPVASVPSIAVPLKQPITEMDEATTRKN